MRRSMQLWWLFMFCPVFHHLRARVSNANNAQDDGSCPLYCQQFPEENWRWKTLSHGPNILYINSLFKQTSSELAKHLKNNSNKVA